MAVKVFLLGRPGSGKTIAFQLIDTFARDEKWHATHFREYKILYEMFISDTQNDFIPAAHGGFEVRNFSVLQESARRLEKSVNDYLLTAMRDEIVCIELARDDYKEAMKYFTGDFLQDAYFLFIETDIETCIRRIHYRVAHAHASRHFVPDSILRGYYAQDNFEYMESSFKDEYKIKKGMKAILNNNRSIEDYSEEIKNFTQAIFTSEDSKVLK